MRGGDPLLDAYIAALVDFHNARNAFLSNWSADRASAKAGSRTKEEAFVVLARARDLYWEHVRQHGCRTPVI
jgi:hypothetical protein